MQALKDKALLTQRKFYSSKVYWDDVFARVNEKVLPAQRPLSHAATGKIRLSAEQRGIIEKICRKDHLSVYVYLLAVVQVAFSRLYSDERTVFYTTAFTSEGQGTADVTTLLPLVAEIESHIVFKDFLLRCKDTVIGARAHQDYLFAAGIRITEDVPVLFHAAQINAPLPSSDAVPLVFSVDLDALIIDVTVRLREQESVLALTRLIGNVLDVSLQNIGISLSDIPFLGRMEEEAMLSRCQGETASVHGETLIDRFEEQVRKTPGTIALVSETQQITYEALDQLASKVASLLQEIHEPIIGVLMDRSEWAIVAMLGILKAGRAYLPIDPHQPVARQAYMLKDANIHTVISNRSLTELASQASFTVISLPGDLDHAGASFRAAGRSGTDPAYVIYTSGSTGNPKGVLVENHSVLNVIHWIINDLFEGKPETVLQKTPFIFDVSVAEIFSTLCSGGRLVISGEGMSADPDRIIACIHEFQITNIHFIPGLYNQFLEYVTQENSEKLKSLTSVFVAGEQLLDSTIARHFDKLSIPLHNIYGPTEAAIYATFVKITSPEYRTTIGKPLWNTQILVLDQHKKIVPEGVEGDLYIGGVNVARGYLNRPELTHERFQADPYNRSNRIYYTGDRASWNANGEIVYGGRCDSQVKVRGYRIELEEIENVMLSIGGVVNAAVLAEKDQEQNFSLVAYAQLKDIGKAQVRDMLAQRLPAYMVPSVIVPLDEMPVLASGKIDRRKLTGLPKVIREEANGMPTPMMQLDAEVISIWQNVLNRRIGLHDNFFAIGGDSIKALQIISRLFKAGYRTYVKDLFAYPTVATLLPRITRVKRVPEQGMVNGDVPLTPIQRYFLDSSGQAKQWFNQSLILQLPVGTSRRNVMAAFEKLVRHHDMLRTVFDAGNGQWVQSIRPRINIVVEEFDLLEDPSSFETLAEDIQRSIDLGNGPLRLALFHLAAGPQLLIVIHHLVVDGVSWRILLEDLHALLTHPLDSITARLPLKTDSFRSWADKIVAFANSAELLREIPFWNAQRTGEINVPGQPPCARAGSRHLAFSLDSYETGKLVTMAHRAYNTRTEELLLTALYLSYVDVFAKKSLVINLEGHGREEIFDGFDVSRTVGWFTTLYPVLFDIGSERKTSFAVKAIKEGLRAVPNKGIGYGILKYLTHREQKTAFNPDKASDIIFNFLGEFGQENNNPRHSIRIADRYAGHSADPQAPMWFGMDISGVISNEVLTLSVSFDPARYDTGMMESFWSSYQSHLQSLITFCCDAAPELTPSDVTYHEITIPALDVLNRTYVAEDVYPLTITQEGIFFHCLNSKDAQYHMQASFRVRGDMVPVRVQSAYTDLIHTFDILRTAFLTGITDRPLQVVLQHPAGDFHFESLLAQTDEAQRATIEKYRQEDRLKGFDLAKPPLLRLKVFQLSENVFELVWSYHHIIMDGWCIGILTRSFFARYFDNAPVIAKRTAPRFSDFFKWLRKQDVTGMSRFWREYLGSDCQNRGVSVLKRKKTGNAPAMANHIFTVTEDMSRQLKELCTRYNVTLNNVLQGLWSVILSRYNHNNEVTFGTVVSGRPADLPGSDNILGLFIQTIPLKVTCAPEQQVMDLFKSLQAINLECEKNCFVSVVEATSNNAVIFDHLFIFENYPVEKEVQGVDWSSAAGVDKLNLYDFQYFDQNNFDFNLVVTAEEVICFRIGYDSSSYDAAVLEAVEHNFHHLITQVIADPLIRTGELKLGTQTLDGVTKSLPGSPDCSLVSLFREQVCRTPDAVALEFDGGQMTYRELREEACALAGYLRNNFSICADQIIGVCLSRNENLIIAILGILEAGAAYVPLDPDGPVDRNRYILEDSALKVLITEADMLPKFESFSGTLIAIDIQRPFERLEAPLPVISSGSLAYVIYTSGSTGIPKGVLVEHGNIVNTILSQIRTFDIQPHDGVLQMAAATFDASVSEIFITLLYGARLVMIPKKLLSSKVAFIDYCRHHHVTVATFTPAFLNQFEHGELDFLRTVISAGEAANRGDSLFYSRQLNFFNAYGPTECAICVSICRVVPEYFDSGDIVPIGLPLQNTMVFVANDYGDLMPVGVDGEIMVTGAGIARGYLNQPALTHQKFITSVNGSRIYRTGDIGCLDSEGNLLFSGRRDSQVKIRGHRVEMDEVEQAILNVREVQQAVVKTFQDDDGFYFLVAYYKSAVTLEVRLFHNALRSALPAYSIPSYFVAVSEFPLTGHGKIDKDQLGPPPLLNDAGYAAPRTKTEKDLALIWSKILNVDQVGLHDNFFTLGGHSLKATALISEINRVLKKRIDIDVIFSHATLRDLAFALAEAPPFDLSTIHPSSLAESYPVSPSQLSFWLACQVPSENRAYTLSEMHCFDGHVDITAFEQAFHKLIARHEILRTVFKLHQGELRQCVLAAEAVSSFALKDLSTHAHAELEARSLLDAYCSALFDLEKGPLIGAMLCKVSDARFLFVLKSHHILMDGWSYNIVHHEFFVLYNALRQNAEPGLPVLSFHFKDYVAWRSDFSELSVEADRNYWRSALRNMPEPVSLPRDYERPVVKDNAAFQLSFFLSEEHTGVCKTFCLENRVTPNIFVLSALNVFLFLQAKRPDIIIGSPISLRDHPDLGSTVGNFLNTILYRTQLQALEVFSDVLDHVKGNALVAYEHKCYPFNLLVEALDVRLEKNRNPVFDVGFTFHNENDMYADGVHVTPEGLKVARMDVQPTVKSDMWLHVGEHQQGWQFDFVFNAALYAKRSAQIYVSLFERLIPILMSSTRLTLDQIGTELDRAAQAMRGANRAERTTKNQQLLQDIIKQKN